MAESQEFPGLGDGEGVGPLVRPYVMTWGRQRSDNVQLDMISVVIAARANVDEMALEPEQVSLLRLCQRPLSVAELSAHLDIPVAVIKVLLSDLISRGYVLAQAPYTAENTMNRDLLQAVIDGIQRL